MSLSQQDIDYLIVCEKKITTPPQKELYLRQGNLRNDMDLESVDGIHKFKVFIRVNEAFQEDFSVGLTYIHPEGRKITIFRCNGPHGGYNFAEHHNNYHVHEANAEYINAGLKSISFASISEDYATWHGAVKFLVSHCNILEGDNYFSFFTQLDWLENQIKED